MPHFARRSPPNSRPGLPRIIAKNNIKHRAIRVVARKYIEDRLGTCSDLEVDWMLYEKEMPGSTDYHGYVRRVARGARKAAVSWLIDDEAEETDEESEEELVDEDASETLEEEVDRDYSDNDDGNGSDSGEDYTDDEDEGEDGYKPGGYHPVKVGEVYNQR